jgi:plastocyanin
VSRTSHWLGLVCLYGLLLSAPSAAQELLFTITIKDHRFHPSELTVPAGRKLKLLVKNLDPTTEEFESHDLRIEKLIPGEKETILNVRPLKPGTYKFVGEFHEKTAQGRIVAK